MRHIFDTVCWKYTERKNGVILTYKVESLVELRFDPGLRIIVEYLSQNESQYRVNLIKIFSE